MSFDKLLAELNSEAQEHETMRKALPADDGKDEEKIQAAAADGGVMDDDNDVDAVDNADEGEGELMGKSLGKVTLETGEEVEAVDGTELVKSLIDRVEQLGSKQTATEGQILKALEGCLSLIKSQSELIKSLQTGYNNLRGEGRGRKTVLNVAEKPAAGTQLAKSETPGITAEEFLAKSHAAFDAGKISGLDLTTIDVSLRQGNPIDASIIQKVLS